MGKSKRSRRSSSSDSSRNSSDDERRRKRKEKRESRDKKRRSEDIAARAELLGYTETDNPFGDANLAQKFVWQKKKDKDRKLGVSAAERAEQETRNKREIETELEKLKRNRKEREEEARLREEEKVRFQREADRAALGDWEVREDNFHLEQAKRRAEIRVKEGRAKAIDVLALNLQLAENPDMVDQHGFEVDTEEPYKILNDLTLAEVRELRDDIQLYLLLERSESSIRFWKALIVVCEHELARLEKNQTPAQQAGVTQQVYENIQAMLSDKTVDQLALLASQIERKLSANEPIDVDYWMALQEAVRIWQAKAMLRDMHRDMLATRLEQLRSRREEQRQQGRDDAGDDDGPEHPQERVSIRDSLKRAAEEPQQGPATDDSLLRAEQRRGFDEDEEAFTGEAVLSNSAYSWSSKYRPRKPKYFNRVHAGYEWNKYNQTHYDMDNPPPKVVQGYKFNIFYPDLINKSRAPTYRLENKPDGSQDTKILRFIAGPPYEDIAFEIVNREWEMSHRKGFKCVYDRGVLQLHFQFKRYYYRLNADNMAKPTPPQYFVVDAFAPEKYGGNPAAVLFLQKLETFPATETLQIIASSFPLQYKIRWFTPTVEVPLCGHATLAAAHILYTQYAHPIDQPIYFETTSRGLLTCTNEATHQGHKIIAMQFPLDPPKAVKLDGQADESDNELHARVSEALAGAREKGAVIKYIGKSSGNFVLVEIDGVDIFSLSMDMQLLERTFPQALVVTCRPSERNSPKEYHKYDFLSRVFAPSMGINEDPVTGSAHCVLTSYYHDAIPGKKTNFAAYQASKRGGVVLCELKTQDNAVMLRGNAITVMRARTQSNNGKKMQQQQTTKSPRPSSGNAEDLIAAALGGTVPFLPRAPTSTSVIDIQEKNGTTEAAIRVYCAEYMRIGSSKGVSVGPESTAADIINKALPKFDSFAAPEDYVLIERRGEGQVEREISSTEVILPNLLSGLVDDLQYHLQRKPKEDVIRVFSDRRDQVFSSLIVHPDTTARDCIRQALLKFKTSGDPADYYLDEQVCMRRRTMDMSERVLEAKMYWARRGLDDAVKFFLGTKHPGMNTPLQHVANLAEIVAKRPDDSVCADCDNASTVYISVNLGVVLCNACAEVHQFLSPTVDAQGGVFYSRIRAVKLPRWQWTHLKVFEERGNRQANLALEAKLLFSGVQKPNSQTEILTRRRYIRGKYIEQVFMDQIGSVSPLDALADDRKHAELIQGKARAQLKIAIQHGDINRILHILHVVHNLDVQLDERDVRSALHLAAHVGDEPIVELLVYAGANPCLEDGQGYTPLWHAAVNQHNNVVAKLKTYQYFYEYVKNNVGQPRYPLSQSQRALQLTTMPKSSFDTQLVNITTEMLHRRLNTSSSHPKRFRAFTIPDKDRSRSARSPTAGVASGSVLGSMSLAMSPQVGPRCNTAVGSLSQTLAGYADDVFDLETMSDTDFRELFDRAFEEKSDRELIDVFTAKLQGSRAATSTEEQQKQVNPPKRERSKRQYWQTLMNGAAAAGVGRAQKSLHSQQYQRVSAKQDDDLHLLQGFADFTKRRAEIEREYAEKLHHLAKSYQKVASLKSQQPTSASPASASNASRPTLVAFQAIVAETETRSKIGSTVADRLHDQIVELVKRTSRVRQSFTKKQLECWQKQQDAALAEVVDLENAKREYDEAEKMYESTSKKHQDLLNGKTGLLSSVKNALSSKTDEDRLEKVKLKLKSATRRLQDTRNTYLLAIEASNIYQQQYWQHDLPTVLEHLDSDYYSSFAELIQILAEQDREISEAIASGSRSVHQLSTDINRDVENKIFLAANDKFFPGPRLFQFDACGNDQISRITTDEVSKVLLSNQLLQLQNRRDELVKIIDKTEKEVVGLEQMAKVYIDNPEFGNATNPMETRVELEMQVTALNNELLKTNKKIEMIKAAGVDVPKQSTTVLATPAAGDQPAKVDSQTVPRAAALKTSSRAGSSTSLPPIPAARPTTPSRKRATVLYDFKSGEPGELAIREGDVLDILADEQDGWIKASLNGREGLVPANYIELMAAAPPPPLPSAPAAGTARASAPASKANSTEHIAPPAYKSTERVNAGLGTVHALFDYAAQEPNELNFNAGDAIDVTDKCGDGEDLSEWWEGRNVRTGQTGVFPYIFTDGWQALVSSGGASDKKKPTQQTSHADGLASRRGTMTVERVQAMFDYTAACVGELTIKSGDMIAVTNKDLASADWWEGRNLTSGEVGQFPKDYTMPV
ncbi:hypothetical protein RI367_003786 [Sorochytrium milnesiophthora]